MGTEGGAVSAAGDAGLPKPGERATRPSLAPRTVRVTPALLTPDSGLAAELWTTR